MPKRNWLADSPYSLAIPEAWKVFQKNQDGEFLVTRRVSLKLHFRFLRGKAQTVFLAQPEGLGTGLIGKRKGQRPGR